MVAHVAQHKKDTVKEFTKLIDEYPIVGVVNMQNLPTKQLQIMRANLREKVDLRMTKRRLINIALDNSKKENIQALKEHLKGMPALLLTKENPFVLFSNLKKNKSKAPISADFLNEHFVSIKVDREQRPDIDQFMMSFITEIQGQGGWPLNVFLTHDMNPITAATYVPVYEKMGLPAFISFLENIKNVYDNNQDFPPFLPEGQINIDYSEEKLLESIKNAYDSYNGGFGGESKFPPHNTLIFLLQYYQETNDSELGSMIRKTLDNIAIKGLHDHLQGGFYRYCVDEEWTIPHFEKMLYDQAMLLWQFSLAYKLFKKKEYKAIAEKIMVCLEETFEENGMYYSGHDADTLHEEGVTYVWSFSELKKIFSATEYKEFQKVYDLKENFEGKIHLIKKKNSFLDDLDRKLLNFRNRRAQPFVDKKIVTSWNCLTGIAFIMAYRYLNNEQALEKVSKLFETLLKKHYIKKKLAHSSLDDTIQSEEFLSDYASLLALATFMHEEDGSHKALIKELYKKVSSFNKKGTWIESTNTDFIKIDAQKFDHPIPSSTSLAEFAILRTKILLEKNYTPSKFGIPLNNDFQNFVSLIDNGRTHVVHSPETIIWSDLPINTIQVNSKRIQDCHNGYCKEFKSVVALLNHVGK